MVRRSMFVVTQVAPYRDGPAGVHGVLGQATSAMDELAGMAGLDATGVADVSALDAESLAEGGVLCLFTIGETPWSSRQRAAIVEGVRSGRLSILGIHSATDACAGWEDYGRLLGARFDGHPWTTEFAVEVKDRSHPATSHLDPNWRVADEVYLFRDLREDARVLLEVAPGQLDMTAPGARAPAHGYPLAWCFAEGAGRVFYTSLGHFPLFWETPACLRHLAGALEWLLACA